MLRMVYEEDVKALVGRTIASVEVEPVAGFEPQALTFVFEDGTKAKVWFSVNSEEMWLDAS